ncbi:MAG TPA: transcriptional regulator [Actinomycetota bacterium]|nr:transcriptional regulator [Actinomycetota bacterium]
MLRGLRRDAGALGALEDELRRRLYVFVRSQGRPVNREEAASAAGISRKLAAFHLDKLVERGLLTHTYARPPGRGGPGAGRSAKYYEPSDREIDVTIPERRYDLLGSVLLRALRSQRLGETGEEAARRAAEDAGLDIGRAERERSGIAPPGPERAMAIATGILEETGFEPYRDDRGCVRLRSCPFHGLAEQERDLVCGMNERLINGVVRGLGNATVGVVLDPIPGQCCVRLEPPSREP